MLSLGTQCVIVPNRCTYAAHWKTIVSLWFSNSFHVAQLARCPRAARARRGPLRRRVTVGRDHTAKSFNFTNFYKGSAISVTF